MISRLALLCALSGATAVAHAQTPILEATYSLDNALAAPNNNTFSPQGLGFDEAANELLFVQSGLSRIIRTDLTGAILGSIQTGPGANDPGYRMVAVAADAGKYYVSDFFANQNGRDVYEIAKTGGSLNSVGTETAARLGTPLDVRGGKLFRTESSSGAANAYNLLSKVRVSSLAAPDTILQTLTLNTPGGIGDLTVDLAGGNLYSLSYGNGDVYRYSLTTGALLATYDLNLQSATAGLAYGNGKLYHYDWKSGTGSKLSVYSLQPVPEPLGMIAVALGVGMLRRRRHVLRKS